MKFSNTLEARFNKIQDQDLDFKKPPVSSSLKTFLQNESIRIDNLITKKQIHSQKLKKVQIQSLQYRDNLKNRIEEDQQKHEKNRKDFIDKIKKRQKFKIDEVARKRKEYFQKQREKRRSMDQKIKLYKTSSAQFWTERQRITKSKFANQTAATPLYEEATERKKALVQKNEQHGQQVKQKLLTKHINISDKLESVLKNKQLAFEEHNKKLAIGLDKHKKLLQQRQKKIINDICFHQDRNNALINAQLKAWAKKLQGKHIDQKDLLQKHKQNRQDRNQRAKSTQQLRNFRSTNNISPGMTKSVPLNQQDLSQSKRKFLVHEQRKDFMRLSQTNFSSVQANKSNIKQKQEIRDEKAMMIQKQISNAVKARNEIKDESNCLIRHARLLA